MISFKDFLLEKYKDSIMVGRTECLIYENPSFSEINEVDAVQQWNILRAIIVDDKLVYAFGDKLLHSKVMQYLTLPKTVLCVEFNFVEDLKKFKPYVCTVTITSTNFENGWTDKKEMEDFLFKNKYVMDYFKITDILVDEDSF